MDWVLLAVKAAADCAELQLRRVRLERRVAASEGVADATVGLNQLLRKVAIYLATQGADIHIDYAPTRNFVISKNVLNE
jgi:hypothetical protein